MTIKQFVADYWPLTAAIAAGGIAWGTLSADVSRLQRDVAEQQTDHDTLIEVRTEQRTMAADVKDIKTAVKELTRDSQRPHR